MMVLPNHSEIHDRSLGSNNPSEALHECPRTAHLLGKLFLLAGLFLFALVVSVKTVDWVSRPSIPVGMKASLDYFEEHKDEFDIVFFGSSRTKRGVMPHVFDQHMDNLGVSIESFNFAFDGMWLNETNALLDEVVGLDPARLRWVLIEATLWQADIPDENWFGDRVIWWHNARDTYYSVMASLTLDKPILERLKLAYLHVIHGFTRFFRVGRGVEPFRNSLYRFLGLAEGVRQADAWTAEAEATYTSFYGKAERRRGFSTFSSVSPKHIRKRKGFNEAFAEIFPPVVDELNREFVAPPKMPMQNVSALREQVARLRNKGIEPIYFISADSMRRDDIRELGSRGVLPTLLRFNDPRKYPELYTAAARYDKSHLDYEGAEIFSRILAEELAPMLRK